MHLIQTQTCTYSTVHVPFALQGNVSFKNESGDRIPSGAGLSQYRMKSTGAYCSSIVHMVTFTYTSVPSASPCINLTQLFLNVCSIVLTIRTVIMLGDLETVHFADIIDGVLYYRDGESNETVFKGKYVCTYVRIPCLCVYIHTVLCRILLCSTMWFLVLA